MNAAGKAPSKTEKMKANLQRLKYRDFIKSRQGLVKGILQRKAEIKMADKQWAERNKRIEKRIARERKIRQAKQAAIGITARARRQAKQKAKQAAIGMAAMARKLLGTRKKRH